ncbi:MAG TPA: VOC family protein [Candidatus Thermoplasmatota archaeon]|nr:VOC family protein [Candidatus Thermoplasmatota archaeon]
MATQRPRARKTGRARGSTRPAARTAKRAKPRKPAATSRAGLTPCLWFDKQALEAARFYVSTFPRSRVTNVQRAAADYPSGKKGDVLLVEFTLDGRRFQALNGGPYFRFNEAVSFVVDCKDQRELDRYYDALSAVPEAEQCGWVKDKFGLSWQLVPRALTRHLASRDAAKAKRVMEAMLDMKRLDVAAIEAAARAS